MEKKLRKRNKAGRSRHPKEKVKLLSDLKGKFGNKCWYCGIDLTYSLPYYAKGIGLEMDHIIPKCSEGSDSLENRALSCLYCNRAKGPNRAEDFLAWLAHIRSSRFTCFILGKLSKEIISSLKETDFDLLRKD